MKQLDQSVHKLTHISSKQYQHKQTTRLGSAADTSQWAGLQYTHFRITVLNRFNKTGYVCWSFGVSFALLEKLVIEKFVTFHFHKKIYIK